MYFQSFGAVSIVKVNAAWFHVRERGTFGGIFGILISLGLYFAYDVGKRIKEAFDIQWIFLVPAMILFVFFVLSWLFVRNNPSDAGHADFDLGDATKQDKPTRRKPRFWPVAARHLHRAQEDALAPGDPDDQHSCDQKAFNEIGQVRRATVLPKSIYCGPGCALRNY